MPKSKNRRKKGRKKGKSFSGKPRTDNMPKRDKIGKGDINALMLAAIMMDESNKE